LPEDQEMGEKLMKSFLLVSDVFRNKNPQVSYGSKLVFACEELQESRHTYFIRKKRLPFWKEKISHFFKLGILFFFSPFVLVL